MDVLCFSFGHGICFRRDSKGTERLLVPFFLFSGARGKLCWLGSARYSRTPGRSSPAMVLLAQNDGPRSCTTRTRDAWAYCNPFPRRILPSRVKNLRLAILRHETVLLPQRRLGEQKMRLTLTGANCHRNLAGRTQAYPLRRTPPRSRKQTPPQHEEVVCSPTSPLTTSAPSSEVLVSVGC